MATQWGRKESIIWPPHAPVMSYSALAVALLCTCLFIWQRLHFSLPPLQKSYIIEYMRAEVGAAVHMHGTYRLLYLGGEKVKTRLALPVDFASGRMTLPDGRAVPFALSELARTQGYRFPFRGPAQKLADASMYRWLRYAIFDGKVPFGVFTISFIEGGVCLLAMLWFSIPMDIERFKQMKYGRVLRGPLMLSPKEFNKAQKGDGIGFKTTESEKMMRIPLRKEAQHLQLMGDTGVGNPITKVRTSAKRLREPDVLSPAELAALLAQLDLRERAMVMLAGSTGLRRSELVALTWCDIDLELLQVNVRRSCVRNHFGDTKTEASRKPVPLHSSVIQCLEVWRKESPYNSDEDFLFPSIRLGGKQPLSPDTLLKKVIRPALLRAGIKGKAIGWHSFRHSLATNLRAAGVDLKTAQELLRHANSRITLDVYTRAISATKREANNRVMEMVFEAGKKALSAPSSAPSRGAQPQKKKGADRSSTLVSTLRGAS